MGRLRGRGAEHKRQLSAQKKEAEQLIQRKVQESEQTALAIIKQAENERHPIS